MNDVFRKIWTEPRAVFNFLIRENYTKDMYLLLACIGVSNMLKNALKTESSSTLVWTLFASLIIGPIFGIIGNYLYASLIGAIGNYFGGKASDKDILKVLAYGSIPLAFVILILVGQLTLKDEIDPVIDFSKNLLGSVIKLTIGLIQLALTVYSFCLIVIGISEVQNFTIFKAFLNLILPLFAAFLFFALLFAILASFF